MSEIYIEKHTNTYTSFMKNTKEIKTKIMVDDHDDRILWDCGSPLYDSYELVSLTHIIERHFMSLPSLSGAGGKMYYSKTPSDLGAKANLAASTVVDLCCSSESTTGKLLCGVFGKKWWERKKYVDVVEEDYNYKKKKMFSRILSGIRIHTTRSCSSKMWFLSLSLCNKNNYYCFLIWNL